MSDLLTIGLSGIMNSQQRASEAADRIAKMNQPVENQSIENPLGNPESNLIKDMVTLSTETNMTKANATVIQTADELSKTTIDLIA